MIKILFNTEVLFTVLIFLTTFFLFDIISTLFFICLFIFSNLNLARENFIKHGINKDNNSRMGGIIIFLFICLLIYLDNNQILSYFFVDDFLNFILILTFVTFLGFADDIIGGLHYIFKLYFLMFIVLFLLISYDIFLVTNSQNQIVDMILSSSLISFLVTLFIILGFINASNISDGANGILSGISAIFFFIIFHETNIEIFNNIFILFFVFFLYNFFVSRIFLGDSGSYLIGFLISTLALYYFNQQLISAGLLATILSYPCLEMSFTVIRRFNLKTNPMKPDNKHLHNIIHIFLKRKIYKNKFEKLTNSTTGLVILSIFSIPSLFLYYYTSSVTSILYWYLFFIQIFLYILIYYYYLKIRKLNSNG